MGTNYYLHKNTCEHCGRTDTRLHIGKSSSGWCFSLRVHPWEDINDLPDWSLAWRQGTIMDEYNRVVTQEDMLSVITERKGRPWGDRDYGNGPLQYTSEYAMLESNHAEKGPNNLLRYRVGPYCKGHGAGTWDLIEGDFS